MIVFVDPSDMLVDHLGAALLPDHERTGVATVDALRILNRSHANADPAKKPQRMIDFNGVILEAGEAPIVFAPLGLPLSHGIALRPAGHRPITEAIHAMVTKPAKGRAALVFLTQKRGATLADLKVSYPSDMIWICRSGQPPQALSRRGYAQIFAWHQEGILKQMRMFVSLLRQRHTVSDPNVIDRKIDALVATLQRPMAQLFEPARAISDETWTWANRTLALLTKDAQAELPEPNVMATHAAASADITNEEMPSG